MITYADDGWRKRPLGMTGTRNGMNKFQALNAFKLIKFFDPNELHHGAAIGADAQCHEITMLLNIRAIAHRPSKTEFMAPCKGAINRSPKPYLVRDRDIVNESKLMLSFPKEEWTGYNKGGTAYTTKYSLDREVPIIIITPTKLLWFNFDEEEEQSLRSKYTTACILRSNEEESTEGSNIIPNRGRT